jgi:valyl-tRNA synthetase
MNFPERYHPHEVEPRLRKFWEEQKIYQYDPSSFIPCFSVDTPPPYVSSEHLHVGHAMSYSQAEFIVRYKRMSGYNIFYPMGFDDNGLPTERYVEKKYRVDKSKISRQEFINLCLKETKIGAQTYRDLWEALGISVDWSLTYSTIDERSRRSSQRSFIELAREGLIERRDEPILWCYHCSTSLAQADVETVEMPSQLNDIAFLGPDGRELIISTTRPELIPACVSLYANPEDERYTSLIGSKVRVPLFDFEVEVRAHPDVDPSFGTGLMMVCTWGDMDDVIKWKEHHLDTRAVFDERGRLNELARPFDGLSVEEARKEILKALKEKGLLKDSKPLIHNIGAHDRCNTPVEFNHSPQWFIRLLDYKEEFLRRGEELTWYPTFMKTRYEDWVRGLKWDWCISRQRYYGVPIPVWYCGECGRPVFSPIESLPVDPKVEPVPPDSRCTCGSPSFRGEQDVMDTWMTSSLTPLINARWAYDDEDLMKKIYPMTVRVQAFEIIRTWLFYTMVKSHFHTSSLPWHDVMISGWGLDAKGKKMSKRLGNFVDPMTVIKKYSADALRYWSAGSTLGNDLRYNEQDVANGNRLMTKLWNAARFVASYLFDGDGKPLSLTPGKPTLPDRWIVSRLMSRIKSATESLDKYEYSHALSLVEQFFFAEYCDNYLEIVKERLWNSDRFPSEHVEAARFTLHRVLFDVLKLFAPFIPYITEELYRIVFLPLGGPGSIHVSEWPRFDESLIDAEADEAGRLLVDVLTGVRRWKTSQKVHSYYPLSKMVITAGKKEEARLLPIAADVQAAAHAESLAFGEGGDVPTEAEKITLKLTLGEKKPKDRGLQTQIP